MESNLKAIFFKDVNCVLPTSNGLGTKLFSCGLGIVAIHDTARCLLKIYLNRKNKKSWHYQFVATFGKKLFLGKLVGVFVSLDDTDWDVKPKTEKHINNKKTLVIKSRSKSAPSPSKNTSKQTEVLFFPDSGIPCQDFYSSPTGCSKNETCPFLHEETAYLRLLRLLKSAKKSIDVCVFCLTCGDLGSTLIAKANNDGVRVRVVTDSEQLSVSGSQIGRLRREGILVRHDSSSYLMHHKFAIIDEELLINGSFNWTRTAITGNHENLVISRDETMVRPFIAQFAKLWDMFHPDGQKGFTQKPVRQPW